MSDDDLAHMRAGIETLTTNLAVHDSKTGMYVERIISAEERVAEAVIKVADAAVEIKAAVVQLGKNGNGGSIRLDRRALMWLVGLAMAGAAAIGGGQEVVHRAFHSVFMEHHAEETKP